MVKINADFALSAEIECLTAVPEDSGNAELAVVRFLQIISELAPSLPSTTGIFNGYAKIYCDVGHIEFALVECDNPYLLPSIFERVQILATRAVERLAKEGTRLVLANNNHSGLLKSGCPVWGDHENHLVEQHPESFAEHILPFLVTRIYQGAGGLHYPTGNYLAAVRPICMELATGGGTTGMRAIHSTAREEHHMGPNPDRFRYHLILGDGHRSHFNLALQFGATALAIKAILFDAQLRYELAGLRREFSDNWVSTLARLNLLATPGMPLRVDPLVLKTQRLYLHAAQRYAATLSKVPKWIPRLIRDWETTLQAYARLDCRWLASHLDAFAKYEFFAAVLRDMGHTWQDLPNNKQLFCKLALLDHNYHEFCNPESTFAKLESAGLLHHRVGDPILPGDEPDPFVPQTKARAQARARFIRDNKHNKNFVIDWSWVQDRATARCRLLHDPFARRFAEWRSIPQESRRIPRHEAHMRQILRHYDRGEYEDAYRHLVHLEQFFRMAGEPLTLDALRYLAVVQARRGHPEAVEYLQRAHGGDTASVHVVSDYCCIYRFLELIPDLQRLQPWIQRGLRQVEASTGNDTEVEDAFREHAAYILVHNGQPNRALGALEPAVRRLASIEPRIQGRILATLGEIHRVLGERRKALRLLRRAVRLQSDHSYFGYLADFTYPSLAKATQRRSCALEWLAKATEIQTRASNRLGHTVSLLLEARIARDRNVGTANKEEIIAYQAEIPALNQSNCLALILKRWDDWVTGVTPAESSDGFWGF